MIASWRALPLVPMLSALALFFVAVAVSLVLLSFGRRTGPTVRRFAGVAPPFVGAVAVIFGILLGFLANDIWSRESRAAAAVRTEADSLLSLTALAATFDLPREPLVGAVRGYAETVVRQEWPSMAHGDESPAAEFALDRLLKTIAHLNLAPAGNGDLRRLLLDAGLAAQAARVQRLRLSRDASESVKWLLVLVLAVTSQIAVGIVHLENERAQMAALTIWTVSLVVVLSLLALHDEPFAPPLAITPAPITHALEVIGSPALQRGDIGSPGGS